MILRIIITVLVLSCNCHAQSDSTGTAYYKVFENKLSTQLFMLSTSNTFSFDYQKEKTTIDIVPNQRTTLGVAVQYDIISFSLGFAPRFFAENKNLKDSKMTSFTFNFFPGRWMQHFDFYYQKGMSLDIETASVYLPYLKSLKIGGNTAYMFNKNFSFKATAFQNEKQLKSAGTFAPTLSYYYTQLKGKEGEDIDGKIYFIDVSLAPAYFYNWVIAKNFLLGGGLSAGAGFNHTVDESDSTATTTSFLVSGAAYLSMGYNSERFFCGLNSRALFFDHQADANVQMNDAIGYFTLFAGYRFDAPSFLQKERDALYKK